MAATAGSQRISDAIQAFALEGRFPDDVSSLPAVSDLDLDPAIQSLAKQRTELQGKVHLINEETQGDVSSWVRNAKELQEDIIRSKAIANEIVRESEAPDVSGQATEDAEERAVFLNREVQYSRQLHEILRTIRHVYELLNEVEQASNERRVLDSLRLLEKSWKELDNVAVSRSCRIMKLLDLRAFELKSDVHEVFDRVWKELVQVNIDAGKIAIHDALDNQQMGLSEAVVGFQAYKEVDERMEQLWRNLDAAVISPRMRTGQGAVAFVKVEGDVLELSGQSEASVESLLSDLDTATSFVARKLPEALLQPLGGFMMAELIPQLIQQWLNPAVPSSLTNTAEFQQMIRGAENLCNSLRQNGYTGFEELSEWVTKAPTVWLEKYRQTTLDSVRARLTNGVGELKQVEKVEKQMVSVSEGKELATTGAGASAETNDWGEEWGAAWDDDNDQNTNEHQPAEPEKDGEDDGADAWGWGEEETAGQPPEEAPQRADAGEDDSAAAWGWGDEHAEPASKIKAPNKPESDPKGMARELVFKETYYISSMPEPVLELISSILDDGAALIRDGNEYAHIASTAPGLFSLPTFVLALFRAVSPLYVSDKMFLYNDAMYLAERLTELSSAWKAREDLTPRARNMLRVDNDIKTLQGFANRSYAAEMNVQKTILRDLLGGAQSILQQDETADAVESGVARIRQTAATWEDILARSVWSQAVGSLVDALATKLITDVLDLSSIGQDEAYNIASLIASATGLDDLFLPSRLAGSAAAAAAAAEDEVPTTAQYAPNWLRLKFLSEVLQSNLNEVRFLWEESELSLYFTAGEVVDLIRASFEDNHRTRETIKGVQARPMPLD